MSLLAALLLAVLAWLVFKSLVAVLIVLAIAAVIIWLAGNGPRRL